MTQLNTLLVLSLSQRARAVTDLAGLVLSASQAFAISQEPSDAARVAKVLRAVIKEADVAATAFEAAAAVNGEPDGKADKVP